MKSCQLALATAATLLSGSWLGAYAQLSGILPGSTDFESINIADAYFSGDADYAIGEDATVENAPSRPANYPFASTRTKVLTINDADANDPLVRNVASTDGASATGTIYADILIKPAVVCAYGSSGLSEPLSGNDKILCYFRETSPGTTNLCVFAKGTAAGDGTPVEIVQSGAEYVLETPQAAGDMSVGNWLRLVVVSYDDVAGIDGETWPGFKLFLGGYGANYLCQTSSHESQFISLLADGTADKATGIAKMAFVGSASIDDFVVSRNDPGVQLEPLQISWPDDLDSISYAIGSDTNSLAGETSPATLMLPAGTVVELIGMIGEYATKTELATVGTDAAISLGDVDIGWYFPRTATAGQDGTSSHPYEISSSGDLMALAAAANAGLGLTASYVQTADIDMSGAGPFAGIGTYNVNPTLGTPFAGTYDGQGHKIRNVDFTQRNYGGVFNQVNGGTIANLTVSNITCSAFSSGEWGGAIVGNAGNGATLHNLVAEGSFGSPSLPGTHNMAGIVIRASRGGATDTIVQNCTNNAAIYGTYTKIGGICAITQMQDGTLTGSVVFDACANNGDITALPNSNGKTPGIDGIAGIIAYTADATTIRNCSNSGTFTSASDSSKIGEVIGKGGCEDKGVLADEGGNSGNASNKLVADRVSNRVAGFTYATVDNGAATTIAAPYTLVKDTTYLLEDNAAPVFELADNGDTIAFNTALGYTLTATGITAAAGLEITSETVGTVTTFTAGPDIHLEPASIELYPNCTNYVYVVGAPAGSTYKVKFGNSKVVSGGYSTTLGWINPKGYDAGTTDITVTVTNDNAQVAQLVCNATVKDVYAVVDGVEYAKADWATAVAAAISSGNVLEIYKSVANVMLSEGDTLRWKYIGTSQSGTGRSVTITAQATTADHMYAISKTTDPATDVTTATCIDNGAPNVEVTKANGTVSYAPGLPANSFVKDATYKILRDFTSERISIAKTGVTIDLNGHKVTFDTGDEQVAITLGNTTGTAGSLTITDTSASGTGSITNSGQVILVGTANTVTIAGGLISSGIDEPVVSTADGGTATITGGSFMNSGSATYLLNCNDNNKGTITVTGGSFQGFNPADNSADGVGTSYVPAGYRSVADSPSAGWFSVSAAPAYPEYIDATDDAIVSAYDTWAATHGADTASAYEKQFMFDVAPATEIAEDALEITAFEQNADGTWTIEVGSSVANLSGTVDGASFRVLNGYLAVTYADTLTGLVTEPEAVNIPLSASGEGKVSVTADIPSAKFFKVKLSLAREAAEP